MQRTGLIPTLLIGLVVSGCSSDVTEKLEPYRCLEGIQISEMMKTEGVPVRTGETGGNGGGGVEVSSLNRVFDLEQTADIALAGSDGALGRLCQRLRSNLSQRCDVREFWEGPGYCAAHVESPQDKITGAGGIYTRRHMVGRLSLFAERSAKGAEVILVGTEWAN